MWQVRKPARNLPKPAEGEEQLSAEQHRLVTVGDAGAFAKRDGHTDLKLELHQSLLDLINLSALDRMSRAQIEAEIGDIVREQLGKQNQALNQAERKQLVADILDELLGLGPLEPLLKDPTITDILVNTSDNVFVERFGVLEPSPVRFKDEKHLLRIIQKIVSAVGRPRESRLPPSTAKSGWTRRSVDGRNDSCFNLCAGMLAWTGGTHVDCILNVDPAAPQPAADLLSLIPQGSRAPCRDQPNAILKGRRAERLALTACRTPGHETGTTSDHASSERSFPLL